MFKIQNGRLYPDLVPQCLSFKIPEGFWLDTNPISVSDYQVSLWTPERDARVEVQLAKRMAETTDGELYNFFFASDAEFYDDEEESDVGQERGMAKDGPHPVEYSGFKGHCAFSCGSVSQCSILLDISSLGIENSAGDIIDRLEVLILAEDTVPIKEIAKRSSVQELLESFSID